MPPQQPPSRKPRHDPAPQAFQASQRPNTLQLQQQTPQRLQQATPDLQLKPEAKPRPDTTSPDEQTTAGTATTEPDQATPSTGDPTTQHHAATATARDDSNNREAAPAPDKPDQDTDDTAAAGDDVAEDEAPDDLDDDTPTCHSKEGMAANGSKTKPANTNGSRPTGSSDSPDRLPRIKKDLDGGSCTSVHAIMEQHHKHDHCNPNNHRKSRNPSTGKTSSTATHSRGGLTAAADLPQAQQTRAPDR